MGRVTKETAWAVMTMACTTQERHRSESFSGTGGRKKGSFPIATHVRRGQPAEADLKTAVGLSHTHLCEHNWNVEFQLHVGRQPGDIAVKHGHWIEFKKDLHGDSRCEWWPHQGN